MKEAHEYAAENYGLTDEEHRLMDLTGELGRGLHRLCEGDEDDWREVCHDIHALQLRILAQAAARLHPDRYRGMGRPLSRA